MSRETKFLVILIAGFFLFIVFIRTLPGIITFVVHPIRLLFALTVLGILIYFIRMWIQEDSDEDTDELV